MRAGAPDDGAAPNLQVHPLKAGSDDHRLATQIHGPGEPVPVFGFYFGGGGGGGGGFGGPSVYQLIGNLADFL
jgi:hypothetical protein